MCPIGNMESFYTALATVVISVKADSYVSGKRIRLKGKQTICYLPLFL